MATRRAVAYAVVLDAVGLEHKTAIFSRLVAEVLGAVGDGTLALDDPGAAGAVGDALDLLAGPHLRLVGATTSDGSLAVEDEEAADDVAGTTKARVGARALAATACREAAGAAEAAVPVLLELKRRLEEALSPLLKGVVAVARALVRDHGEAVTALAARDADFAAELAYDLRQLPPRAEAPSANPGARPSDDNAAVVDPAAVPKALRNRRQAKAPRRGRSAAALGDLTNMAGLADSEVVPEVSSRSRGGPFWTVLQPT